MRGRVQWIAKIIAGMACLAATLALMSPDVITERADEASEGLASVTEPGPVCEVQPPAARLEGALAQHRGQLARRASHSDVVPLNNSGYNHRPGLRLPPPAPEPRR